jgi:hypothetical protein
MHITYARANQPCVAFQPLLSRIDAAEGRMSRAPNDSEEALSSSPMVVLPS